jgi:hypothetical protein
MNGTDLSGFFHESILYVIPAQAGIHEKRPLLVRLDPGLRRDDGGFNLSQCHSFKDKL